MPKVRASFAAVGFGFGNGKKGYIYLSTTLEFATVRIPKMHLVSLQTLEFQIYICASICKGTVSYGNQGPCANFGNSNRGHRINIRGHQSNL